jgi:hypothetical protein
MHFVASETYHAPSGQPTRTAGYLQRTMRQLLLRVSFVERWIAGIECGNEAKALPDVRPKL